MTKTQFLAEYRAALLASPDMQWAQDQAKLDKFMASVETTVRTEANTWNIDSPIARAVWRRLGGQGRMSYKALRALEH